MGAASTHWDCTASVNFAGSPTHCSKPRSVMAGHQQALIASHPHLAAALASAGSLRIRCCECRPMSSVGTTPTRIAESDDSSRCEFELKASTYVRSLGVLDVHIRGLGGRHGGDGILNRVSGETSMLVDSRPPQSPAGPRRGSGQPLRSVSRVSIAFATGSLPSSTDHGAARSIVAKVHADQRRHIAGRKSTARRGAAPVQVGRARRRPTHLAPPLGRLRSSLRSAQTRAAAQRLEIDLRAMPQPSGRPTR